MKRSVDHILRCFGTEVTLYSERDAESQNVRAVILPKVSRSLSETGTVKTALGLTDDMRFLYLGPAEAEVSLTNGAWLSADGCDYEFIAAEPYIVSGTALFITGTLRRRGEI